MIDESDYLSIHNGESPGAVTNGDIPGLRGMLVGRPLTQYTQPGEGKS